MAHFYGTLEGNRGEATRCGSKDSGVETYAAGWGGAIRVKVYHEDGKDHFVVCQVPWRSGGVQETIATGILGKPCPRPFHRRVAS
ncbi:MAG: hypothetical protein V3S43_06205 [Acidimicrobiia bacterium]